MSFMFLILSFAWFSTAKGEDAPRLIDNISYREQLLNDATRRSENSSLKINGLAQFRYTYSNQNIESGNDAGYGFEVRRVRLDFSGNLNDNMSFRISPIVRNEENVTLQDMYLHYTDQSLGVTIGQFRPIFLQELNVQDENIVGTEHSILASSFGQTYTQGVQGTLDFDRVTFAASFTDGRNMENTPVSTNSNNYGVTARGDIYLISRNAESSSWTLGGAILHEDDFTTYTVDTEMLVKNFSATLAYILHTSDFMENVNGAYATIAIGDRFQPFIRQEYATADQLSDDLLVTYFGLNSNFMNRSVRWTNEVGYSWNEISSEFNLENSGFSSVGEDPQFVLRSSLQFLF